jgi:hypothetical protein
MLITDYSCQTPSHQFDLSKLTSCCRVELDIFMLIMLFIWHVLLNNYLLSFVLCLHHR